VPKVPQRPRELSSEEEGRVIAGRLTLWGAEQLLGTYFGRAAEPPTEFYLALIADAAPTAYVSGDELDEPGMISYQRALIPNDVDHWGVESQPQITTNLLDVSFVMATEDWGILRYWALCNAFIEGYCYFVGELEQPVQVNAGDTAVIGTSNLSVSLGPFFSAEADE
jgi:hypothetical protein